MDLIKAQYRSGRAKGDLPRTLRQGVRIGFSMLDPEKIVTAAVSLGLAKDIAEIAVRAVTSGREQNSPNEGDAPKKSAGIDAEQKAALARLETAIDARIDAALSLAEVEYVAQTKILATFVAIGISLFAGCLLGQDWPKSLVVGIAAVPLAPVAKDLATALQSAVKAMGGR
jgi:alkylation response protein AidB-like acyl-CoA dehydrogenase